MSLKANLPIWVFVLIAAIGLATSFLLVNYGVSVLGELGLQSLENVYWTKKIPQKDTLAGWKTYRNYEYGFEVKYPLEMGKIEKINESKNRIKFYYEIGSFPVGLDSIEMWEKPSDVSFENLLDYINNQLCKEGEEGVAMPCEYNLKERLTVDGRPALLVTAFRDPIGTIPEVLILGPNSNTIFEIGVFPRERTDEEILQVHIDAFNQILSTFKFIEAEQITEIKLNVRAPLSTAMLTIDSQGNIFYEATPDVGDKKTDTGKITTEQYNELVDLINKNNFFSLEKSYIDTKIMDATSYNITIKRGQETKSVGCYGEYPEKFMEIVDKIKELWGKEILEVGM